MKPRSGLPARHLVRVFASKWCPENLRNLILKTKNERNSPGTPENRYPPVSRLVLVLILVQVVLIVRREIVRARNKHRRDLQATVRDRRRTVDELMEIKRGDARINKETEEKSPRIKDKKVTLKRYLNE